ncbi:MAG: hypothetical protein AB1762_22560, partial [Gemmatimonadota bacterium]
FVLLDPAFASAYCFALEPAPIAHPDWVGLALSPARNDARKVSIEGVLWMTRAGALQRFDFRYIGLDRVLEAAQPGGRVEFYQLPSGQWIVSRWMIRMPQGATQMEPVGFRAAPAPRLRLVGVVERGAFASRVEYGVRQFVELSRQVAILTLRDQSGQPLRGTTMQLPSEGLTWTVDSSRSVRTDPLRPGVYQLFVQTPLMRDVGIAPERVDLTILPDTNEVAIHVSVPSLDAIRRKICPGGGTGAAAFGRVRAARRAVHVSRVSDGLQVDAVTIVTNAVIDSTGRWHACGLPRAVTLALWTEHAGGREILTRFRIPRAVDLAAVGSLDAPSFALARSEASLPNAARLVLRVIARDSSPLLDAEAVLDDTLVVRANARGELRIPSDIVGTHNLVVRRIGYAPHSVSVTVSQTQVNVDTVYLVPLPQRLAEVTIRGRVLQVPAKFADVIRRSASGWGTVFTREEIRNAPDLKSLLATLPGVVVSDREVGFARCGPMLDPLAPKKIHVYIDAVRVSALPDHFAERVDQTRAGGMEDAVLDAMQMVSPSEVEYMEVYRGVAQIPVEF